MPAVGFLNSASADGYASMAAAFRMGLKEAGYADGQNVAIEYRWADNQYELLPALAVDLVKHRQVKLIFANSPSIPAALAATKTIPIVFNSGDDPVRLGFVKVLAGRVEMPPAWLFFQVNWRQRGLNFCASLFQVRRPALYS